MKPALTALFTEYEAAHRHPTNRLTHKVAIPLIVFQSMATADWLVLWQPAGEPNPITLAHVAWLFISIWALRLDVKLGAYMTLALGLCFPLARLTPWWVVLPLGGIGWVVQLLGHALWEKNRPAFLRNLVHALVGPFFFIALLSGDWKLKPITARVLRAAPAPLPSDPDG